MYRREAARYVLQNGLTTSERVAVQLVDDIKEMLDTGSINEYKEHLHYAVNCDHSEVLKATDGCVTIHKTKDSLHTVCLLCNKYLWGPKGEYPK